MKKQFILKGRLVKASLAETVISELGLEACIGEGGGRGRGGCFRKRGSVDRGVLCELLGNGERIEPEARGLLCEGYLCTCDIVSKSFCRQSGIFRESSNNQVQMPFGVFHVKDLSIC